MKNFTAIDFETAQPARHTACAIALVKVRNGVIIQKFKSLIRPPDNWYSDNNMHVHKIGSQHTENAPDFAEIYPLIRSMLHNEHIVCHNASFDVDVLYKTMEYYGISSSDLEFQVSDTLALYGKCLKECCNENGISLSHHDPLSDAEACAQLFLRYQGADFLSAADSKYDMHQKIRGEVLKPDLESVEDKSNPFFGKKVVISGTFNTWPDRTVLARELKERGADIDSSVGPNTQILIAGDGVGPKKLEKMTRFINQSH